MDFIKGFSRNLFILVALGLALIIFFPDIMGQVFNTFGALFGPVAILLVIAAALPKKSS